MSGLSIGHATLVPWLQRSHTPMVQRAPNMDAKDDPKVGERNQTIAPLLDKERPTLFLAAADCMACTLGRIDEIKRHEFPNNPKFEIVLTSEGANSKFTEKSKEPATNLNKAQESYLNPYFTPRIYAFSQDGKLIYAQSYYTAFEEAVKLAKEALEEHGTK